MTHSTTPGAILTPTMKLLHASQDVLKLRPQAGLDVVLIEDLSLSLGSPRMRDRAARLTCEISTDGRPAGERIAIERLRNAVREYDMTESSTRRVLCLKYGGCR
jgi:hypothetical protein